MRFWRNIMPTKSHSAFSRKDAIFAVLLLAILLIGTATDSAIALLVMSVIGLAVMAVFYQNLLSGPRLVAAVVAAIMAGAIALFASMK